MKMARRLGLFVALAFLTTACGTKAEPEVPASQEQEQADVQTDPEGGKAAEPKAQAEGNAPGSGAGNGGEQDPDTPVSSDGQGGGGAPAPGKSPSAGGDRVSPPNPGTGGGGIPEPAPVPAAPEAKKDGSIRLAVTHHFGSSRPFDQQVFFANGQSLLDVMHEHLEIETAYGGTFVNGINGTTSGYTDKSIFTRKKRDWFFYQNGSVGSVGADSVAVRNGDDIWWDFHDWSGDGSNGTPAVIGSYPHPFTTGYNGATPGTVIYYGGAHGEDANRLAQGLQAQGAANVRTAPYDDGRVANAATNVIVLGTWNEVGSQPAVAQLFSGLPRTGLYASYADGSFHALTHNAKQGSAAGKGLIAATGQGSGDTTPVWLVLGATEEALDSAVNVMVSQPGKLRGKVGAVLNGQDLLGVPVAP